LRTAIIYSQKYLEHETGSDHPERPQRLTAIMNGIRKSKLVECREKIVFIKPSPASLEDLQLVHTQGYIEKVKLICEGEGGLIDEETPVSKESFEVAKLAAGGAIKAVREVISGNFDNAFVLSRPPGHHAGSNYSLGFCIFNNVALAAKYLIVNQSVKRILILDVDAHHGNGTQEIFYNTSNVLYVSVHEDPTEFPRTGFAREVGVDDGRGYTVNVPLPFGSSDPAYWKAFKNIVLPIVEQYSPQFILVSAGFDGYYRDSVSDLALSAYMYPKIFQTMLSMAHKLCDGKIVAVLEGGYNLWFLKRIVAVCIGKMAGISLKVRDRRPPINPEIEKEANKVINVVRRIQSRYWSL